MAGRLTKSCEISEDIDLDDFVDDIGKIILLQAIVRGYLVRKWVDETRNCFEAIAQEIEQRSNVTVEWKYPCLCSPAVRKKRRKQIETEIKNMQKNKKTDIKMKSNTHENVWKDEERIPPVKLIEDSEIDKDADGTDFQSTIDPVKEICVPENTCDVCVEVEDKPSSKIVGFEENYDSENSCKSVDNVEASRRHVISDSRQCDVRVGDVHETDKNTFITMASTQTDRGISCESDGISTQTTVGSHNSADKSTSATDLLPVRLKSLAIQTDVYVLEPEKDNATILSFPQNNDICSQNHENVNDFVGDRPYCEVKESRNLTDESSLPLGDSTSFWGDSSVTLNGSPSPQAKVEDSSSSFIGQDPEILKEKRHHIAMELLWVQQAIQSRKNYLRLKHQMKTPVKG